MPLSILLPMVIIGIGGIAVLLHLLGLSRPVALDTEAKARAAWLREFPGTVPDRIVLSQNRQAALVEGGWGRGLVWPMGADTTARFLTGADITPTDTGLRVSLPDYTAPHVDLVLDQDDAAAWAARLKDAV